MRILRVGRVNHATSPECDHGLQNRGCRAIEPATLDMHRKRLQLVGFASHRSSLLMLHRLRNRLANLFGVRPKTVPSTSPARHDAPPLTVNSVPEYLWTIGKRRPLIGTSGEVVGFEFGLPVSVLQRIHAKNDTAARAAYLSATLKAATLIAQTGRIGLARLPAAWLSQAHAEGGPNLWLAAEFVHDDDRQATQDPLWKAVVEALRRQGLQVGWEWVDGIASDGPEPSFRLVRQGTTPMPELLSALRHERAARQSTPIVLTDIADLEDFEQALADGVQYLCGALSSKIERATRDLPPQAQHLISILNQINTGADNEVLIDEIKFDVSLSYQLLHLLTSARYAHLENVVSIERAVLVLGRKELHHWLFMLLLQQHAPRKVSRALQEVALWRASLFEALARYLQAPDPGQLFTLGLASVLDTLLGVDKHALVTMLKLPHEAQDALLLGTGPWQVYMELAQQLSTNTDASQVGGIASEATAHFGGVELVIAFSEQAWAWAREHMDKLGAAAKASP